MKGNKMSAILAILLMLSGALFVTVPYAHAYTPPGAGAVAANVLASGAVPSYSGNGPFTAYPYNPLKDITGLSPGYTFWVYIDVINVTQLFLYQVGFKFNATVLQIINCTGPGTYTQVHHGAKKYPTTNFFLSAAGPVIANATKILTTANSNVTGLVPAEGFYCTDPTGAENGSGALLAVCFCINPAFADLWTDTYPGNPVNMNLMSLTETDIQLILTWIDGSTKINPTANNLFSGQVVMHYVPPVLTPPTAHFVITSPLPPYYQYAMLTYDGSSSTPGSYGSHTEPITTWYWDFGDGNKTTTHVPVVLHNCTVLGDLYPSLIVEDTHPVNSTAYSIKITQVPKPTGCIVDAFTQNWRYIDPITIIPVPRGKGANTTAELFRPGDLVQILVETTYNQAPVAGQFVAIEVWDNLHTLRFTGIASATNSTGTGELDFRIPWAINPVPEFGLWEVFVTWEIGTKTGLPPFSQTQNDTLYFHVGWGVWSDNLTVKTDPAFAPGGVVTVKYNLHNDYMETVTVLNTVTVYDDLMVPVAYAYAFETVPAGTAPLETITTAALPYWTFVGTGTVKCDELTTWPAWLGTAWGPEQVATFTIKWQGPAPTDP
jgi:hypothetical protein